MRSASSIKVRALDDIPAVVEAQSLPSLRLGGHRRSKVGLTARQLQVETLSHRHVRGDVCGGIASGRRFLVVVGFASVRRLVRAKLCGVQLGGRMLECLVERTHVRGGVRVLLSGALVAM